MHRRAHLMLTCALALAAHSGLLLAQAQTAYPSKPIRLVVPFVAGSAPDTLARLLAPALGESMSTNVVVENVAGAGGTIGVDRVAKAAPDGYTLLVWAPARICSNLAGFKLLMRRRGGCVVLTA